VTAPTKCLCVCRIKDSLWSFSSREDVVNIVRFIDTTTSLTLVTIPLENLVSKLDVRDRHSTDRAVASIREVTLQSLLLSFLGAVDLLVRSTPLDAASLG
jgi:hypothetical protein